MSNPRLTQKYSTPDDTGTLVEPALNGNKDGRVRENVDELGSQEKSHPKENTNNDLYLY